MQHLSAINEGEMVAMFRRTEIVGAGEHVSLVLLAGLIRLTAYVPRPDCLPPSLSVLVGYAEGMVK